MRILTPQRVFGLLTVAFSVAAAVLVAAKGGPDWIAIPTGLLACVGINIVLD